MDTIKFKKFKSRTGEPVRLALLSGHTAIVTGEWISLAEYFYESAYAAGCISEDMVVNTELRESIDTGVLEKLQEKADLKSRVRVALEKAVEDNDLKAFNKSGNPTAVFLKRALGETVPNHIKDEVWYSMLNAGYKAPNESELSNDIT